MLLIQAVSRDRGRGAIDTATGDEREKRLQNLETTPDGRHSPQPPCLDLHLRGAPLAVEQLLTALLAARAELHVLPERLRRQLEHARGRRARALVRGEDGEDVARGDACLRDGGREEHALAEGRVCVHVDPALALVVRACGCGREGRWLGSEGVQ